MLRVVIDTGPVEGLIAESKRLISDIDARLESDDANGLRERKNVLVNSISLAKSKLGERERQFVRYKEELIAWAQAKAALIGDHDKVGSIAWLRTQIELLANLPSQLEEMKARRGALARQIHEKIHAMVDEYKRLYGPVQSFVASAQQMDMQLPLMFNVRVEEAYFEDRLFAKLSRQLRGSFYGIEESEQRLRGMLADANFDDASDAVAFAVKVDEALHVDQRDGQGMREVRVSDQLKKGVEPLEVLNYIYGLEYLSPKYSLTYAGQEIGQLSPGERGLLLLVFYLLVDKDDIPLIIDQPEENLDNQTIFKVLVKCVKRAKERRQVIMVTHNPNLAVVCDAEQIICASCDKAESRFDYKAGAIESMEVREYVVQILEGTEPAFRNRQSKYRLH